MRVRTLIWAVSSAAGLRCDRRLVSETVMGVAEAACKILGALGRLDESGAAYGRWDW